MQAQHESLATGRWHTFSLAEQMGNIGSEMSRAVRAGTDRARRDAAVDRGRELLDLTIADPRWRTRLRELTRVRELIGDASFGGVAYGTTFADLDHYFYPFACAAQAQR